MKEKLWIYHLSLLNDKESNSIISMSNEYIEKAHNEIMNLRQLIWFQDDKVFRAKVSMDGIEDGEKLPYSTFRTDYFDKLDELDLKLMEIRRLDRSKQKADTKHMDWLNSDNSSPLKKREKQLTKLEKEAKQYDEEINRQNEQEGQDIGEI